MTAALMFALLAGTASAATPREIAEDLRDGRLDGAYTRADLEAYLQSPMAQGYGGPSEIPLPPVEGVAGVQTPPQQVGGAAGPLGETAEVGALPFTGLDLALLAFGGALLLLLGFGARRLGRRQR